MVQLNIRYTFVVMAKNCDVIVTSSVRKIPFRSSSNKVYFSGLFFSFLLKYIRYYINKHIYPNRFVLIFLIFFLLFFFFIEF